MYAVELERSSLDYNDTLLIGQYELSKIENIFMDLVQEKATGDKILVTFCRWAGNILT